MIEGSGKFSQKYGWFEIRCRVPMGKGYWPAFWLLPDNRRQCAEALALVRRVLAARGALPDEGGRRLERIEAIFEGAPAEGSRDKAA